ncbi:hypothetical protein AB0E55_37470 [Amycolatopsis keratiniphila]|uniref:hypothetical protein n=1 Tax=Amycolatopsis keratiniphila TaxID=129921 RepID=UPI003406B83E
MRTVREHGAIGMGVLMSGLGVAAVLAGWRAEGYLQSTLLEVGSAMLLLAPLGFAELAITRRIGRRVEDGVAEALNGTSGSPHPDDAERIRNRLIRRLHSPPSPDWEVTDSPGTPFAFMMKGPRRSIAVVIRHTPFPLDTATVRRMMTEARIHRAQELIVISLSPPTELAADFAKRTPGLRLIAAADEAGLDTEFATAAGLDHA